MFIVDYGDEWECYEEEYTTLEEAIEAALDIIESGWNVSIIDEKGEHIIDF